MMRKFKKRKVIVGNIDDIWSADLVDMQQLKSYNHGFRNILNVIDVFSNFVLSVPMKDKTGKTITNTFQSIVKTSKRKPNKLWVDNGSEFYNNVFKKWLVENEIKMYSTFNEGKAVVIERFKRTLKNKMHKFFTVNNTYKYVDVLTDLINEHNNHKHSTIKMTPTEASIKYNEKVIQTDVYSIHDKTIYKSKFMVGDRVRINKYKRTLFDKGYTPNWSEEVFVIVVIQHTNPTKYIIKDYSNEIIEGWLRLQQKQNCVEKDWSQVRGIFKDSQVMSEQVKFFISIDVPLRRYCCDIGSTILWPRVQ